MEPEAFPQQVLGRACQPSNPVVIFQHDALHWKSLRQLARVEPPILRETEARRIIHRVGTGRRADAQ